MQTRPSHRREGAITGELAAQSFPLVEVAKPPADARSIALAALGATLLGGGLGLAATHAMPRHAWLVALLSTVASGLAGLALAWQRDRSRRRRAAAVATSTPRVRLDDVELSVVDGSGPRALLRVDRPFGATLFATPERDRLVLALTHRDGVAYLAASAPSGEVHDALLGRTITTPRAEIPIEPRMPTFERGDRLLDLVHALSARSRTALDRVWLSDAGMSDLVIDGKRLRAGEVDFDLGRPLRWRGYVFQEGSALTAQSYQATSVRQGEREVVMVSLAPSAELATSSILRGLGGTRSGPLGLDSVQRALSRDLRLARGLPEMPPPRSVRVAVDRLFVPRIRAALDLAPTEEPIAPARTPSGPIAGDAPIPQADGVDHLRSSRP